MGRAGKMSGAEWKATSIDLLPPRVRCVNAKNCGPSPDAPCAVQLNGDVLSILAPLSSGLPVPRRSQTGQCLYQITLGWHLNANLEEEMENLSHHKESEGKKANASIWRPIIWPYCPDASFKRKCRREGNRPNCTSTFIWSFRGFNERIRYVKKSNVPSLLTSQYSFLCGRQWAKVGELWDVYNVFEFCACWSVIQNQSFERTETRLRTFLLLLTWKACPNVVRKCYSPEHESGSLEARWCLNFSTGYYSRKSMDRTCFVHLI